MGSSQLVLRSFVSLFHSLLFIAALLLFRYSVYTCRHVRWISNKLHSKGSKFLSRLLCPHTTCIWARRALPSPTGSQPNNLFFPQATRRVGRVITSAGSWVVGASNVHPPTDAAVCPSSRNISNVCVNETNINLYLAAGRWSPSAAHAPACMGILLVFTPHCDVMNLLSLCIHGGIKWQCTSPHSQTLRLSSYYMIIVF